jgi:hypothetical protein
MYYSLYPLISARLKERLSLSLLLFSKIVVYLIGITLVIAGLVFLLGGHLRNNGIIFAVAATIVTVLITWEFRKHYNVSKLSLMVGIVTCFLIISLLVFLMGTIYDKSWDGLTYHQKAIIELNNGWNPVYKNLPYEAQHSKYYSRKITLNLWVNHYGKGSEIFAAVVMGLTKNIESGKVFNILLLLASFCSVLYTLSKIGNWNYFWLAACSLAAAFNPIAVNQLFSYYLDGAVASLVLILVSQFILLLVPVDVNRIRTPWLTIFFTAIILANFKFTGLIYLSWISGCLLCLLFYLRRFVIIKRLIAVSFAAGIAAVFVTGFNPYVTNTKNFGHPFYPLAGNSSVDISAHNIPQPLKKFNALGKLLASTFSRSENVDMNKSHQIKFKIPFTFSKQEIRAFQSEGIRLGGMGVLWSGLFCSAVLLSFVAVVRVRGRERLFLVVFLITILVSVIVNPVSWWARFVPQVWLLPAGVFFFLIFTQQNKALQRIAKLGAVLLLINSLIIVMVYTHSVLLTTKRANIVFTKLQQSPAVTLVYFDIFTANEKKLEAKKIRYVKVDHIEKLACDSTIQVLKMDLCNPAETITAGVFNAIP